MSKFVYGVVALVLAVLSGCASQGDVVGTSAAVAGQGSVPAQVWSNDD